MLRSKAAAVTVGVVVLSMLGLLVSGAVETWQPQSAAAGADADVQPSIAELAPAE